MVRRGLSAVANQLESANHLTDSEEAQALSKDDTAGNQLTRSQATDLLNEVLGRPENAAASDGLPQGLVVALEGGERTTNRMVSAICCWYREANHLRRAHLLSVEDNLASLEGDLAVVDNLRGLLY